MEKNKTGKYIKYAIGEIILVVIGILIALQINTLNEQKKDRKYEVKMLSEMINALEEDEKHFNIMLDRIIVLDSMANYFMTLSKNKVTYHDTIFSKVFSLNSGTSFQVNSGPYQAIKSSGLDKISNDSLRNKLINFYDFKVPLYTGRFEHTNRNYQDNIETLLSLLGERHIATGNGRNFVAWKDVPADIFQQQQFLEILSDIAWRTNVSNRIFIDRLDELQKLKMAVKLEINHDKIL